MQISGWAFLIQQTLSGACLLLAVGRCLGAPMRLTLRLMCCAASCALACAGAFAARSAAVRLTLIPVLAALPVLAFPQLFPASLPALPPISLMAAVTALGWTRLLHQMGLPARWTLPAACAVLLLLPRLTPMPPSVRHASLAMRVGRRRLVIDALMDSGNLLRDPLTGLPVIVLSPAAAKRLDLPDRADDLRPGMRLTPIRTASGGALVILVRPDELRLDRRPVRAMLGVAPVSDARYNALVPVSLLSSDHHRRITI